MSEFEESFYDDDDDQPVEPPQNPVRARMKQLEKETGMQFFYISYLK